jgi:hypothetical protein
VETLDTPNEEASGSARPFDQSRVDKAMKAITYHSYGSPDVLEYTDVEMPTAGDTEVLIKAALDRLTA